MPEIDYRTILGVITVLIGIYAYIPYIRDILRGKTTPHIFSWIVFCIMDIIAFLIQFGDNAGPGSWGMLTTGIGAFIILLLALKSKEKNITTSDAIALALAFTSVALYLSFENALYSQIMILFILTFAMYPTFRKSYHKPGEETTSLYIIAIARSVLSIFAAINISFLTIGTPIFIIAINSLFVSLVLIRRKQLGLK